MVLPLALWPPYILMYCWRRGSTQVVVRVLWSTKYGRPSGVCLCSHPDGSSPVPAVVAPVAIMLTALAEPAGGDGCRSLSVGEFAPVRSSGSMRF
jgi:hypothetical protein